MDHEWVGDQNFEIFYTWLDMTEAFLILQEQMELDFFFIKMWKIYHMLELNELLIMGSLLKEYFTLFRALIDKPMDQKKY